MSNGSLDLRPWLDHPAGGSVRSARLIADALRPSQTMKAAETRLRVLFEGQKQFIVPLFQRRYAWTRQNWETWWADLLEVYDVGQGNPHFIGAIVSKSLPHSPEGVSRYLIIDGQQRLVTTAILLASLRDCARGSLPDLAEKVEKLYLVNDYATGWDRHKVVPTQDDRATYFGLETQSPSATDTSPLAEAYAFFSERIRDALSGSTGFDLKRLEQTIVSGIETVSITLEAADDEYRIFESLNAKGMRLTQADLIRNYILMAVPIEKQDSVYATVWDPIQRNLGSHVEDFFRHLLMSAGQFVREDDVYSAWKSQLSKLDDAALIGELGRVSRFAAFYHRLIDPATESSPGIRLGLERLNQWGRLTVYPFLLGVYADYSEGRVAEEDFQAILSTIEAFFVRRMFLGVPTNELNRMFARLPAQLGAGATLSARVRAALSEPGKRWPDDAAFRIAILSYPLYTEGRPEQRKLVIERIEEFLEGKERVELGSLSIEHIMPQTLSKEWEKALGTAAVEVHQRFLHVLGNLTLTGYNPELSNETFDRKREFYERSPLVLNREIAAASKWGPLEIEARGNRLASLACSIWIGPDRPPRPGSATAVSEPVASKSDPIAEPPAPSPSPAD